MPRFCTHVVGLGKARVPADRRKARGGADLALIKPTIQGQLPRHWLRPLGGQGEHAWTLSRRARAQCLPQPAA